MVRDRDDGFTARQKTVSWRANRNPSPEQPAMATAANPATPTAACDVLVIGGGPAGSTISAFLAKAGHKVVLLEKDHHPRFHIGESLLPMNVPLFERLGVLDDIKRIGLPKFGAEFNDHGKTLTWYFTEAMVKNRPNTYEVRRSEFDEVLIQHTRKFGTEVHEGVRVTGVDLRPGQGARATSRDDDGTIRHWEAKYVVDATGRDTLLANRFGMKQRNPAHNSSAVFGHFEGVPRRPGKDEGNISIYWFDHGWYWMIPLKDGAMSVGAVCWSYYLKSRKKPVDEFLWDTLNMNPMVAERMQGAKLMAPALATGNFSYQAETMYGDGWMIVGDAFAFIDPVFSSGVYLAMNSAERGAKVIDEMLRRNDFTVAGNRRLLRHYERTIRKGLGVFSWFIYRITTPAMRKMFMNPRNIWRMEEAVLSVLSADVFDKTPIHRPILAFKTIYWISTLWNWRESLASWRQRQRAWNTRLDYEWQSGD
jgi:flavin-dependent dehydrogenase